MHRRVSSRVPREWRDPDNWPRPPDAAIASEHLKSYRRRCAAITDYLRGESLVSIFENHQVRSAALYKALDACLMPAKTGGIRGFSGAVPYSRGSSYVRKKVVEHDHLAAGRGASGLFQDVLGRHPELSVYLNATAEKYATEAWTDRRLPIKTEHNNFCSQAAKYIKNDEYPFNITSRGREGFRTAFHNAIARHRGRKTESFAPSIWLKFRGFQPAYYRRVQIDAHRLDKFVPLRVEGRGGRFRTKSIRPWLIAAVEVESTNVIGWHLSIEAETSAEDVLCCLYDMMRDDDGHEIVDIPEFVVEDGKGLPSLVVEGCASRFPDVVELDNALAHHAQAVREAITTKLFASVQHGRSEEPRRRAEVEQSFNTITHRNVQHAIMGIRPDATNRERELAEKNAQGMTIEAVEAYLRMVIGRYNDSPTEAHYGKVRLECLREEPSYELRRADTSPRATWRGVVEREMETAICASDGHPPHINALNATYTNELLRAAYDFVGQRVVVVVNLNQPRTCTAFVRGGISFGVLTVQGPWGEFEHDFRLRRFLSRAKSDGRFHWVKGESPEQCVSKFLSRVVVKQRYGAGAKPSTTNVNRGGAVKPAPKRTDPPRLVSKLALDQSFDVTSLLGSKLEG